MVRGVFVITLDKPAPVDELASTVSCPLHIIGDKRTGTEKSEVKIKEEIKKIGDFWLSPYPKKVPESFQYRTKWGLS